jgi:hypothetical protein
MRRTWPASSSTPTPGRTSHASAGLIIAEVLDKGGTGYVRADRDCISAVHREADAAADEG